MSFGISRNYTFDSIQIRESVTVGTKVIESSDPADPSTLYDLISIDTNGNLLVDGVRIGGVANPIDPQDVATKDYIDSSFLKIDGGIVDTSGARITNASAPIDPADLATKAYVDTIAGAPAVIEVNEVTLSGGTTNLLIDKPTIFITMSGINAGNVPASGVNGMTIKIMIVSAGAGSSYTLNFGTPTYPTNLISAGGISSSMTFSSIGLGATIVYHLLSNSWILQDGGAIIA